MTVHEVFTLISLWGTAIAIYANWRVVHRFWPMVLKAIRSKQITPLQWFGIGVFLTHLGGGGDNSYWAFPWSTDFIVHPSSVGWFADGVFSNTFLRQGLGSMGAICHLIGTAKTVDQFADAKEVLLRGSIAGFIFVGVLMYLRTLDWL